MRFGARELILDAIKLAVGVFIYTGVDPLTTHLGGFGYVLSLLASVAGTIVFSWVFLNQSSIRLALADELERLPLTGPEHDVKVAANSKTSTYRLTLSWTGSGPLARHLTTLALKKALMTIAVDIPSSMATLVKESGDGVQPRSAIRYQPDSVEDNTWQWTKVSVSVGDIPATSTDIAIKYTRSFKSWRWVWLGLFIHLEPDIKTLRLIRSTP